MRILVLAALALAAPAWAAPQPGGAPEDPFAGRAEAPIRGAAHGAIRQYAVFKDGPADVLFLETRAGDWFRAKLDAPCPGADSAELMVFRTRGGSAFDANASVWVDRARCDVASVVQLSDEEAVDLGLREGPIGVVRIARRAN